MNTNKLSSYSGTSASQPQLPADSGTTTQLDNQVLSKKDEEGISGEKPPLPKSITDNYLFQKLLEHYQKKSKFSLEKLDVDKKTSAMISEIEKPGAGIDQLCDTEREILRLGICRMLLPLDDIDGRKNCLDQMIKLEKKAAGDKDKKAFELRFAVDEDQVQIVRKFSDTEFRRFGVIVDRTTNTTSSQVELNSVYAREDVDLHTFAPEIASYINNSHGKGKLILSILGPARVYGDKTKILLDASSSLLGQIISSGRDKLAILTGGYKGEYDGAYGATRAGYDAVKRLAKDAPIPIDTLVVMPEAGEKDSHRNVTIKNIVGKLWGDDTKALVRASDAAVVFAPHGMWTEIEIANLKKQKVPYWVVDVDQNEDGINKALENIVQELQEHNGLTPEALMKQYNPELSKVAQPPLMKKPSAEFDHDKGVWGTIVSQVA